MVIQGFKTGFFMCNTIFTSIVVSQKTWIVFAYFTAKDILMQVKYLGKISSINPISIVASQNGGNLNRRTKLSRETGASTC